MSTTHGVGDYLSRLQYLVCSICVVLYGGPKIGFVREIERKEVSGGVQAPMRVSKRMILRNLFGSPITNKSGS